MDEIETNDADRERQLDRIIADYACRIDAGEQIDRAALLGQYPDLADLLTEHFEDLEAAAVWRQHIQPPHSQVETEAYRTVKTTSPSPASLPISPSPLTPNQQNGHELFGRYRIQQVLGEGAMGAVYLATDTKLNRRVALKFPKADPNDSDLMQRFLREARAAATLSHRNICQVYDIDSIGDCHYISMAYIEGSPLSSIIQEQNEQEPRAVAQLVHKLALAMAAAHDKGIVHRDLKPSNIMVDGEQEPVIMDFGLAAMMVSDENMRLTRAGMILGTPAYMSPEQIDGELERIDGRSDVFSLGVIFYELLSGQLPFKASTVTTMWSQIATKVPVAPSQFRDGVDSALEEVCLKALAKRPEERFSSMAEMAEHLANYLAAIDSKPKARAKVRRRSPWLVVAGLAAAMLLATVIYIATDFGTIKIELSDPKAKVEFKVNGNSVALKSLAGSLRLRAGEHGLEVKGENVETVTRIFTVRRGPNDAVTITLIPKETGPVRIDALPAAPSQLVAETQTPQRSPKEISARRKFYLDQHLTSLLTQKNEDFPAATHAADFPPNVKTEFDLSTEGLTFKTYLDWDLKREFDADRKGGLSTDYYKAWFDTQGLLRQIECYDNDGARREGPFGCAIARYWYDDKRQRVEEAFFGTDGQPRENNELIIFAHHAYAAERMMESRYYDAQGEPAEDRFGVHRRVYDPKGAVAAEYRLDASRRELWLDPINLGWRINQDAAWRPAITADGREIYFATGWRGGTVAARKGIYRVLWKDDHWSDPEPVMTEGGPMGGLNPSISSDGRFMAVFGWKSSPYPHHRDTDEFPDLANYGGADIYIREKKNGIWQWPRNAGPTINAFDQEGGACFIPGTYNLCVSTRQIRGGSCELGISDLEGDEWMEPRLLNVGEAMHPVLTPDGQRLFFSSARKGSFGFEDIWVTQKRENGWSRPFNLGSGINQVRTDDSAPALLGERIMYFSRCGPPWNIWVTGRADDETAIRHMADIYALGEWELPAAQNSQTSRADAEPSGKETNPANGARSAVPSEPVRSNPASSIRRVNTGRQFSNSIGMRFVLIPPGEFDMGSKNGDANEQPVHRVSITKPFYLGKYEVTQGEYIAVMGANPSKHGPRDTLPVEFVTWENAVEFCRKLSEMEGRRYRLPSEAEWEYSCRAGTTTEWSFGDDPAVIGEYAWVNKQGGEMTHDVGLLKPNDFGLYDMHGNVFEYCSDWTGSYGSDPETDPAGAKFGRFHGFRGGSWFFTTWHSRSAKRQDKEWPSVGTHVGFRVVLEFDPQDKPRDDAKPATNVQK